MMTKHDSLFRIKTARQYILFSMITKKKKTQKKSKCLKPFPQSLEESMGDFSKCFFFYINLIKIGLSFRSPFVFVARESDELDKRANFN